MSSIEREEERGSVPIITDASRKRAAIETYSRHEEALRRTARRYSICVADADDALQRALEILLVKAPTVDPRELIRWSQTVVKHEALAIRRDRERTLSGPAAATPEPGREDWVALLPSKADGPPERAERQETIARSREALRALKPQELRALTLLAEGYSYKEIAAITGYSQTKINRCLAEGREKFRSVFTRSRDGSLCEEMRPLLSAFCDGEVGSEEEATLREHLRACAGCRATLRAYRAAPGAAAALLPAAPGGRSLFERAHDALAGLGARFSGSGSDSALSQVAASGGTRGAGMAALAKLAAICAATAGGAAACVATGIVPTPLALDREHSKAPVLERKIDPTLAAEWETGTGAESGPASITEPTAAAEPAATPAPEVAAGATEYAPPPEPAPVAAPAPASAPAGSGSPAG
ncbi:MAG TPA: sigma-70 family RNA polymerase sigma factor, partial [Solirubrobacterales bacterium]|nr:sigma-70 family RNA polymerase sigma factor [Solirubrobacterales bacterium]